MNDVDLKKRALELEQTLALQLEQLKKDSKVWLIGGGLALFVGFLSYKKVKNKRRKKDQTATIVDSGKPGFDLRKRKKKKKSNRASFFPSLKKRLFLTLLSYGQTKLVDELNRRKKN